MYEKDFFDKIMLLPILVKFYPFYEKNKEILLYLFFGGLSFFISVMMYILFYAFLGYNELIANVISWVITVMFAFFTNRLWVFKSNVESLKDYIFQMISFYGGRVITLIIEEVVLFIFITCLHFSSIIVKIVAQVIIIVLNYVISKLIIFRNH